jgi:hypothetical protein
MATLTNGQLTTQAKRLFRAAGLTPERVRSVHGLTSVTFASEADRDQGGAVLTAAGWTFSCFPGNAWLTATSPDSGRFGD